MYDVVIATPICVHVKCIPQHNYNCIHFNLNQPIVIVDFF